MKSGPQRMRMEEIENQKNLGCGDSKGKGDQDWNVPYRIKKRIPSCKEYASCQQDLNLNFNLSDVITDSHTIVITNLGNANKKDVDVFLKKCLESYNNENNDTLECEWRINLIVDKLDIKRGIAYVYFKNSEFFNILIGNFKNGAKRVSYVRNPHFRYDNGYDNEYDDIEYKNICLKQEEYIAIPISKPLFEFPIITLEDSACEMIVPHIVPFHVAFISRTNVLICNRTPNWVTEEMISKKISILKERNVFINIIYNGSRINNITYVIFPSNMMATFSLILMKKLKVKDKENQYNLFFKFLR